MQIKIPKRIVSIGIIVFVATIAIAAFGRPQQTQGATQKQTTEAVFLMKAKGGYFPSQIKVPAGKESTLRVITENTYDCTSAIVIPDLNVSMVLPPTGNTDITLPALKTGSRVAGGCSSDHEQFTIIYQ